MKKDDVGQKSIPKSPGVYFFIGAHREILYIGKATSLQQRVKSYFCADIKEKRSVLIEKLVTEAKKIEWTVTDSVLEAMLLETNLIRTHKPRFNTMAKDDKSYNHVVITKEEFARVLVVRGKDVAESSTEYYRVYGPFPSGALFKEALKIIRKLFQFYDGTLKTHSQSSKLYKGKIDFNRQIGLYPEECSKTEYARTIRHICLFFEGKKTILLRDLEREMLSCARREEFEVAGKIKKKIFALQHIQDIALIKDESRVYRDARTIRIEAYDIAHMAGKDMVGVLAVVKGGVAYPSEYRKFIIRTCKGADDTKALREVIERRLRHTEWMFPELIVADGGIAQVRAIEKVLVEHRVTIPVVGVVKDEHHKPKTIIGSQKIIKEHSAHIVYANAEAHRFAITFHRTRRRVV